jgi:hypothetical protein
MTWPGYKQTNYEKIVRIAFPTDHFCALLKAGDWEWANLFHEALVETAATFPIENEFSIRKACDKALVETRKKILDAYNHPAIEPGAAAQWLKSRETKFIVAYVHFEKPFFYSMDLLGAVPCRVFHRFAAIGSGSDLASFFLNNIDTRELDVMAGFGAANYIIEQCIKHSEGCGGPMMAKAITKSGKWNYFTDFITEQFRDAVRRVDEEHFKNLAQKIEHAIQMPK